MRQPENPSFESNPWFRTSPNLPLRARPEPTGRMILLRRPFKAKRAE
jgi:hypothetical protein